MLPGIGGITPSPPPAASEAGRWRRSTRGPSQRTTARSTAFQCGADKRCIGHRTSEVLEFVPAQFRIIEEQREKLACPSCPEQRVTTADSEKVMDRGRPRPGLLANIIVAFAGELDRWLAAAPARRARRRASGERASRSCAGVSSGAP
ncbi:IS66 family transposase zinc-finger binding domain-containing protein [Sorangium sp. So ce315]